MPDNKNSHARLRDLEAHFSGGGDDYAILRLLGRNDPESRTELGRLVDAAPGEYTGMVQVARIYLAGFANQGAGEDDGTVGLDYSEKMEVVIQ
jgi:hypothetical protein